MMTLRVEPGPCEAGSNRPASGALELRLWERQRRIDKAELQVRSVCFFCNSFKGSNIAGFDPLTKKLTRLFHPRRHRWAWHFRWSGPLLTGRTAIGRVTIQVLQINCEAAVVLRESLLEEGLF
jgi:hypothetical protein